MIYLVFIPLGILLVPWLLARYVFTTEQTQALPYKTHARYLVLAAGLWITAFFVPNIPISTETSTFSQHAFGGMVATALFLYAVRVYRVRFAAWWQWLGALYLFASGLGVANELFELLLTKSGLMAIESSDVWWDLLANTLGAYVALGVYGLIARLWLRR